MRHHFPYVDAFRPVLHDDNDAIVITRHIKDDKGRNVVGGVVELLDMTEVPEVSTLHDRMPLAAKHSLLRDVSARTHEAS